MESPSQKRGPENRLTDLILGHLDDRLSDDEFAELQTALNADEEARAHYASLARMDSELRDVETHSVSSPAQIPFPTAPARRALPWGALAIAAAIVLAAVPVALFLRGGPSDSNTDFAMATTEEEVTRGIAVITTQAGAVWESAAGKLPTPGLPLTPGRLSLLEGLAQIDFFGGASISLSSPAEIELISPDAAILYRGRLKADVPPAARGFEVKAGDVLLEDLGTSFGLAVGEDEDTAEIMIFDGEVRAIGSDGQSLSLYGGDAAHLQHGAATPKNADETGTFPDITDIIQNSDDRQGERYQRWKTASEERRQDARLIAYYDFEGLTTATRRLENRAVHGAGSELDGGIVGARVAGGRWGEKTALDFRIEGDRVRFVIPGEFDALTLYAWVRIDALDRHLNSLFLTDYFDENEIHWQLSEHGKMHFAVSPMGVVDIPKHNRRFYSNAFWNPAMSGQWFLLATTADTATDTVIHYVNGEPVGMSGGTNRDKPLPKLRIGEADLGNWSKPIWPSSIRTLNGRIDEFALFSEVLSPTEIRTIYEQGKP